MGHSSLRSIFAVLLTAALLLPAHMHAQDVTPGSLIRASQPAVYYVADNGNRYAFPNEKIYQSWYTDFSSVRRVTDDALAAVPLGGVVTYRPGIRLVKVTTDPKVYAVDRGGTLRWVQTEAIARSIYGPQWSTNVHDLPDAFFSTYTIGDPITNDSQFNADLTAARASSISVNLGVTAPGASASCPASSMPTGCVSNASPVFTHHITNADVVDHISAPINLVNGTIKAHSYIWTSGRVPVYAPVDSDIETGVYVKMGDAPPDYGLTFRASCEVTYRFGHVTEPIPALRAFLPSTPKIDDSRTTGTIGPLHFRAGDLIGYTSGTSAAHNWDFGVYNCTKPNALAEDPQHNQSTILTTAVCPFTYFSPALREWYQARIRTGDGNITNILPLCS